MQYRTLALYRGATTMHRICMQSKEHVHVTSSNNHMSELFVALSALAEVQGQHSIWCHGSVVTCVRNALRVGIL